MTVHYRCAGASGGHPNSPRPTFNDCTLFSSKLKSIRWDDSSNQNSKARLQRAIANFVDYTF